jgi:hypothetical protein
MTGRCTSIFPSLSFDEVGTITYKLFDMKFLEVGTQGGNVSPDLFDHEEITIRPVTMNAELNTTRFRSRSW